MGLARISPGKRGFEERTFECSTCGRTDKISVPVDPMRSAGSPANSGRLADTGGLEQVELGMNADFYRQQAQRVPDLAEMADRFTRKRLLDLAGRYDAKAGNQVRTSRTSERRCRAPRRRCRLSPDRARHDQGRRRRDQVRRLRRYRIAAGP
jgi:hypothetical protein